jgi:hypothetical protein
LQASHSAASRGLSTTYVLDVSFHVRVVTEDYGITGSVYHDGMGLFNRKKKLLDEGFLQKSLERSIREEAQAAAASSLAFCHTQHMVPLKSEGLTYRFQSVTTAPTPAPDGELRAAEVQYKTVDETVQQEEILLIPFAIVGASLLVVYVLARRSRGQSQLATVETNGDWRNKVFNSEHGSGSSVANNKIGTQSYVQSSEIEKVQNEAVEDLHIIPDVHSRYRQREGTLFSDVGNNSSTLLYDKTERIVRNVISMGGVLGDNDCV